MNKLILTILLSSVCCLLSSKEHSVPLLTGDYPDPTILRDGSDYYMTHSPFVYMPGFLIWHSTDLLHWQPIGRALPETGGDLWAADLVKHGEKYYIYYPANGTNYVIWSTDIRGPWSQPIDLHIEGIDPGHVVGPDGTRWLHTSGGYVVQLAADGLSVVGKQTHVYDGWKYPDEWQTECFCLEGPKLTFHNGWYYLTSAQGGTAGPATSHMVVSARSKSPTGPWENSPYNPIVHTFSADETWWSRGHGSLVEGPDGRCITPTARATTAWADRRCWCPSSGPLTAGSAPASARGCPYKPRCQASMMTSKAANWVGNGPCGKSMPRTRCTGRAVG